MKPYLYSVPSDRNNALDEDVVIEPIRSSPKCKIGMEDDYVSCLRRSAGAIKHSDKSCKADSTLQY